MKSDSCIYLGATKLHYLGEDSNGLMDYGVPYPLLFT